MPGPIESNAEIASCITVWNVNIFKGYLVQMLSPRQKW